MSDLQTIIIKSQDERFKSKVWYHLIKAAIAVINEADTTENHINRLSYAKGILGEATLNIDSVAFGIATNSTIAGKMKDGGDYDDDLEFVVAGMYDAFATAKA